MRIGSLFTGYGGLDLGVLAALGAGSVAWHCEIDPAACRVLTHQARDHVGHPVIYSPDHGPAEYGVITGVSEDQFLATIRSHG